MIIRKVFEINGPIRVKILEVILLVVSLIELEVIGLNDSLNSLTRLMLYVWYYCLYVK